MTKRKRMTVPLVIVLFCLILTSGATQAASVSLISKDDLKQELGDPNVIVLDVRARTNWLFSASKIQGAVREDPANVAVWEGKYPKDKILVLYCQTDVTSSGVARQLMFSGYEKVFVLKGGWSEWSKARFPSEGK